MSSSTNFLKLFKWDTKTDGSEKFDIDKCMNGNWDKLETNAKLVDDTLATKSDKKIINKWLSEKGWYRIAKFNRTNNPQYGTSIVRLWSLYNNNTPQTTTMIITNTNNLFEIEILSSSTPTVIPKLRLVQDTIDNANYIFLEAYYNVAISNNVFLEITDESSYSQTMTFEKTEENAGTVKYSTVLSKYNLNDVIGTLSNLSTTDKTSLVNALNELNKYTRTYMSAQKTNASTLLTEGTFDEIMDLGTTSIFNVTGESKIIKGDGFPTGAYGYGLLITLHSSTDYSKTQIYIPDNPQNHGLYVRTKGDCWIKLAGETVEPISTSTTES